MSHLALPGTVVAQRQRQAFNLVARGYTIGKIAKTLGVCEKTVAGYIEARKAELSSMVERIDKKDYATLVLARFEQTRSEAWSLVEKAQKPSDRIKALKLVVDVDTKEAVILQKLGLVEEAPKREEKKVEATIRIEQVNRDHLDALAAQMLADKMGITPEEAIAMCGYGQRAMEARERALGPHVEEFEEEIEEGEVVPMTKPLDFD